MLSKGLKERNLSVNGFKGLYKQAKNESIDHESIDQDRRSEDLAFQSIMDTVRERFPSDYNDYLNA